MQSLRFKKIRICSEQEQKAIEFPFNPRKTLFLGDNSTGKSTIIKSLFRAFDTEPTGDLRSWDYDAIVAVDFSVGDHDFVSIRKGDLKALYLGQSLLGVTTSSSEWNDLFASAVGFKLQLMDREERFRTATPSMFFMPFYMNQDGSFFGQWETFKSIKQFDANALPHTLEYFAQVRPVEYFELKGKERKSQSRLVELEVEAKTLQRTRQRLRRTLRASSVKLTSAGFEHEVHELTRQATELGAKQEKLRFDIVESQELARQLADQIRLSEAALREHEADFKSVALATVEGETFRCPTCHAEHDASFHTYLDLAEDARELYRMKELLQQNLSSVNDRLFRLRREASALKQQYIQISGLLAAKRGRLTFEDVVKSYSADAADSALDSEIATVQKDIAKAIEKKEDLKLDLATLMKDYDSNAPLKLFRESFREMLVLAGVDPFDEIDKWKLNKRPSLSGSPGPRSVVAYYSALWATMKNKEGQLPSPIVIDSPNQNAQDRKNLERLMALLAGKTPSQAQVILCAEEESDAFKPDLVIKLEDERALLKADLMGKVSADILPMVEKALAKLAQVNAK